MGNLTAEQRRFPKGRTVTKAKKIKASKEVLKLYVGGLYTLESCCNAIGIEYNTFSSWITEKNKGFVTEVRAMWALSTKEREMNNQRLLKQDARRCLHKNVKERLVEEESYDLSDDEVDADGKPKKVNRKIKTRVVSGDTRAAVFLLKNLDKEHFSDEVVHTGDVTVIHDYENLTDEELDRRIKAAEARRIPKPKEGEE